MVKFLNDEVLDASLAEIAEATTLCVCSAAPTTRAEAITTYKLADQTVTPGNGNGDFTVSNLSPNGRKLTIEQQDNVTVDSDGDATHVALVDGTRLLLVTPCTTQPLTMGNSITVNPFNVNSPDAT